MKFSTRLDSATFQLTPTRTRCDLIISAKGKIEKIASGLLNPFLDHLRTAKEQLAKGGYSIVLEPEPNSNSTWFTKGTVERFVRFVSTPEILERVYTIESEILQIEEAIVIQGHNDVDMVDENQRKPVESVEGSVGIGEISIVLFGSTRSILDTNEEKAIVLYQPGVNFPEANGSTAIEENAKVQLMKVLETRKSVLQKEQGMAFARAVAAGFHVDDMSSLMSFAECFGAVRLMDAGIKYIELWKKKHETGQWLEIEPTDAIASRSDFSAMNVSGVMLTDTTNKQNEYGEVWVESHNEMCADGSRKVNNNMGEDEKMPMTNQLPTGHQEYFPGQYPPHLYPPWPIHSPQSSVPVFHPYPMQGMPYYQNYAGNNPYFQSPYPTAEDSGLSTDKKRGQRRHSMGNKDSNIDSETGEVDSSNIRVQDDLDMYYGTLEDRELQKKGHKSGKKKAGTVVIRNINYISSRKHDISDGEEPVTEEEEGEYEINNSQTKSKNSLNFSRTERNSENLSNRSGKFDHEGNILGNEANGHWQAFENFLLKDADERTADKDMFAKENEGKPKRRQKMVGDDLLVFGGRDTDEIHDETIMGVNTISGKVNRLPKSMKDELLISKKGSVYDGRHVDSVQYTELEGRRTGYNQTGHDDFMVNSKKDSVSFPLDHLAINGFDRRSEHLDRKSSNDISDSYIVSLNTSSLDQVGNGCIDAIDMDSEFPSAVCGTYNLSNRVTNQLNYTPEELILMPERGMEKESTGYDHALDFEMQIQVENNTTKGSAAADVKKESTKLDRDRKLKIVADGSDKRKTVGPMRRGKPSKLSPLDEARVRAEKLRTYKADLQKMKREKEVEEIKRLEALKMERQKRISSRGTSAQPSMPSQQSKKHMPTKLSPSSLKGSKFTDSEPGSLSPLQRSTRKNNSVGSSASNIASKPSRSNIERDTTGQRLSKSVSSLPEPKKENGGLTNSNKASMTRMRRLSEPKTSSTSNTSVKSQALEPLSKQKTIDGSEKKKISAIIVNHDRSKAATLPELKIRTSIKPDPNLGGPVAKEMAQNVSSSTSEGAHIEIRNDTSPHSEGDDKPVIEKTVLMLECGSKKPFVPKDRALDEKVADIEGIEHQSPDLPFPYEVALGSAEKETPKFSISRAAEKPYNAPYARLSSLEDPSTRLSDYGKAPPTNLELAAPDSGSKAHVSNFGNSKLGKVPAFEKPEVKESSKGFKRLLKFGRKNHSSAKGEHNVESDNVSIHSSEADESETNTAVSNEVHTLKTLISQEETAAASTSQKSSRSFSLLSPFRKSNEKKLVVL